VKQNPFSALWTLMGGGKTSTALTAASDLLHDMEAMNVLIVAPLRVANRNWHNEAAKWEHTRHLRFHRLKPPPRAAKKPKETEVDFKVRAAARKPEQKAWVKSILKSHHDCYVANVEQVEYLVELFGKHWPFDMVIVDESSLFKNSSSKRWKSLRRVKEHIRKIVQLTGTPASNGLMNLWAQIFLLDNGDRLLRTMTGFKAKWFDENKYTFAVTPRPGAKEEIMERVSDIVHVVSEYDGLPPINEVTIPIEMPEEVSAKYRELEREYLLSLPAGEIEAPTAATLWNKLLQFSNGAIYDENKVVHEVHTLKIDALKQMLDGTDEPVIIAYTFRHDVDRIKKAIKHAVELDKQGNVIDKWERGEINVLLMHPKSGGHGIDGLQFGGRTLIWFGATSDLDLYDQMNARLRRSGQQKTVFVNRMILEGTLEESVLNRLKDKGEFQSTLLEEIRRRRAELMKC
jgi:SNF2 family DNA or RNA helicase